MKIRSIDSDDAEDFAALRREVTQGNPVQMGLSYEEELTRTLQGFRSQLSFTPPNVMYGCYRAGELVATAAVAYTSKFPSSRHKMMMWGVFTSPRFRRQRIGRSVVETAIRNAFDAGVRRVNLQVYIPNEAAVALYKSIGFSAYGVEPEAICLDGKYYDGVHMTLVNNQE